LSEILREDINVEELLSLIVPLRRLLGDTDINLTSHSKYLDILCQYTPAVTRMFSMLT